MKNRADVTLQPDTAPWVRCPHCDDYHCTIHNEHVADCDCPPIDMWLDYDLDPYAPVPEDMQLALKAMLRTAKALQEQGLEPEYGNYQAGDETEEHF